MTQPCPQCGSTMTLDTASAVYRCKQCRHTMAKPYESLEQAAARIRAKGERPPVTLTHQGSVDPRAQSVFETGHDYLWQENTAAAVQEFKRALEIQPDFADPHLWIAKLSDDEKVKRNHLSEILAHNLGHQDALRMMMILNGRLTPEQAAQTYHDDAAEIRQADAAITSAETLRCPVCGGHLTVDDDGKRVYCRFCGHESSLMQNMGVGSDILGMALLERKATRVQWVIGDRLLHCNQCGADRTLPARKLSMQCPFCGSMQVILQDAERTFEQPDGLIPFEISEAAARDAIRERLASIGERLYSVRDNNKVARATMEGVYLPFWVFDGLLNITVTTVEKRAYTRDQRWLQAGNTGYSRTTTTGGVSGLAISGVETPAAELTDALGEYNLEKLIPYEPKLLAHYPAELYEIDFDAASLEARSRASHQARDEQLAHKSPDVEMTVFASVVQMSFSLVLMPVWITTLTERDGDLRTALINGQTGQVALGKAKKSRDAV